MRPCWELQIPSQESATTAERKDTEPTNAEARSMTEMEKKKEVRMGTETPNRKASSRVTATHAENKDIWPGTAGRIPKMQTSVRKTGKEEKEVVML